LQAGSELLGALWPLTALTRLSLSGVGLPLSTRRLNASLRHLTGLQQFSISSPDSQHGWGLDELPLALCALPVLSSLRLVHQFDVRELPAVASRMTDLQELTLRCV